MGTGGISRIGAGALLVLAVPLLQGNVGRLTSLDARILAAHNRERAAAGLPALHWDESLAADAAPWAAHLATLDTLEHADDPDEDDPEGENLWLGTRGHYAPEEMVGLWIAE